MYARVATTVLAVSTLAALGYSIVYTSRWEWQRATFVAVLTTLCAVAWAAVSIHARLRRLEKLLTARPAEISEPAPPVAGPRRFRWLESQPESQSEQYGVFIPVLLGAGILASGLAWSVERLARAIARPTAPTGLTAMLGRYAPADTLLVPYDTPLAPTLTGAPASAAAEGLLRYPGGTPP